MANQGKHKNNPVLEWMQGEEGDVPTKSRGSHVVDCYIKKAKTALKGVWKSAAVSAPPKPEPALMREPAAPPKAGAKPSQSSSLEHQRKAGRLTQLRAPYSYKNR